MISMYFSEDYEDNDLNNRLLSSQKLRRKKKRKSKRFDWKMEFNYRTHSAGLDYHILYTDNWHNSNEHSC